MVPRHAARLAPLHPDDTRRLRALSRQDGIDLNGVGSCGITALAAVAREGREEVARLLLELGADPNQGAPETGATPLHYAAAAGHTATVQLLATVGCAPPARPDKAPPLARDRTHAARRRSRSPPLTPFLRRRSEAPTARP